MVEPSPSYDHYYSLIIVGISLATKANARAASQLLVLSINHTIIVINLLSTVIQLPKANSLSD